MRQLHNSLICSYWKFCHLSLLCVFLSGHSSQQKIQHYINKTFFVGDTVILHCNNTSHQDAIHWKMNNAILFSYDSFSNKSMTNFTSDRMNIKPASFPMELKISQIQASDAGNYSCYNTKTSIRWILTKTGHSMISIIRFLIILLKVEWYNICLVILRITEKPEESTKQIPLYIISSCSGLIMVCLIIILSIWIHRWERFVGFYKEMTIAFLFVLVQGLLSDFSGQILFLPNLNIQSVT